MGVAQSVELRIVIPAVEGSNPFVHPSLLQMAIVSRAKGFVILGASFAILVSNYQCFINLERSKWMQAFCGINLSLSLFRIHLRKTVLRIILYLCIWLVEISLDRAV